MFTDALGDVVHLVTNRPHNSAFYIVGDFNVDLLYHRFGNPFGRVNVSAQERDNYDILVSVLRHFQIEVGK